MGALLSLWTSWRGVKQSASGNVKLHRSVMALVCNNCKSAINFFLFRLALNSGYSRATLATLEKGNNMWESESYPLLPPMPVCMYPYPDSCATCASSHDSSGNVNTYGGVCVRVCVSVCVCDECVLIDNGSQVTQYDTAMTLIGIYSTFSVRSPRYCSILWGV